MTNKHSITNLKVIVFRFLFGGGLLVFFLILLPEKSCYCNEYDIHKNIGLMENLESTIFLKSLKQFSLPVVQVHPSNENFFATPVAWFNESVYVINVEPPDIEENGINLKTVVRKLKLNKNRQWYWQQHVIENRTIDDRYHTQGSIGIDKKGYIHIAYNMHNMPWQYKVSKAPGDIASFDFFGELVSTEQLSAVKHQNKTPFPKAGSAAIPGTQITYPAFFNDRNKELYITYRFATRPERPWKERGFAGGIAKYNSESKKWKAIGRNADISDSGVQLADQILINELNAVPFAFEDGWSVYLIRLHFDKHNNMHVSWTWREGGAGTECSNPSYAFCSFSEKFQFEKADGENYTLPVSLKSADIISRSMDLNKISALTAITTDKYNQPYIIVSPIASSRVMYHYNKLKKEWAPLMKPPMGASDIFVEENDCLWAFASGINVFFKKNIHSKWKHIYSEKGYGWPKVHYVKELNGFFIHSLSDDRKKNKITWINADR